MTHSQAAGYAGAPPMSNTGVETTNPVPGVLNSCSDLSEFTIGLGWLKGTIKTDPAIRLERSGKPTLDLIAVLYRHLGELTSRQGGGRWYRQSASLADGKALLFWDGIGQANGTMMIDVTQTALDRLGFAKSVELLSDLLDAGVRLTRLDVFVDDHEAVVWPSRVWDALQSGQVVTHSRHWKRWQGAGAEVNSETVYVGTRKSERLLRVYRKPEEDERYGVDAVRVRWELELHNDYARDMARRFLDAEDRPAFFWGYLAGFVDFRKERSDHGHGTRSRRLSWFEALTGSADRIKPALPEAYSSIDVTREWIENGVARSLAQVVDHFGTEWLEQVLEHGRGRADRLKTTRLDHTDASMFAPLDKLKELAHMVFDSAPVVPDVEQ